MFKWLTPELAFTTRLFWLGFTAVGIGLLRTFVMIVQRVRAPGKPQRKYYPWYLPLILTFVNAAVMVSASSTYMTAMAHGDLLAYGLLGLTCVVVLIEFALWAWSLRPGSGITQSGTHRLWWGIIRRLYYGLWPALLTLTLMPLTFALLCHILSMRSRLTGSLLGYGWTRLADSLLHLTNRMLPFVIVLFILLAIFVFVRKIVRGVRGGIRRLAGKGGGHAHP